MLSILPRTYVLNYYPAVSITADACVGIRFQHPTRALNPLAKTLPGPSTGTGTNCEHNLKLRTRHANMHALLLSRVPLQMVTVRPNPCRFCSRPWFHNTGYCIRRRTYHIVDYCRIHSRPTTYICYPRLPLPACLQANYRPDCPFVTSVCLSSTVGISVYLHPRHTFP